MSTKDVHAEVSSAQNFHPEFGYLCPSAQLRRKVRSAALTVLAGMVIAAGTALALVPQLMTPSPGDGGREESMLPVVAALSPIDKAADKAADEGMPVTMVRSTPVTERSSRSHAQTSCDDLSGSFLAPRCQFGKAGKSHMTRSARAAASHRVATIPIGRTDAPLQVQEQRAELKRAAVSRSAPVAETAPAACATNDAAAVLPPEKPPAPAKKPVRIAHKQAPRRDVPSRDIASADTLATAPQPGFGLFNLFHEPLHTMSW